MNCEMIEKFEHIREFRFLKGFVTNVASAGTPSIIAVFQSHIFAKHAELHVVTYHPAFLRFSPINAKSLFQRD